MKTAGESSGQRYSAGRAGRASLKLRSLEFGELKMECQVKAKLGTPETTKRVQPDRAVGSKDKQEAVLTIRWRETFIRCQ